MSIRDLIKAGRVDVAEELYEAALALLDATEDATSIRDMDEADERLFRATNKCTAVISRYRAREEDFAKMRKSGELLSLRDLTETEQYIIYKVQPHSGALQELKL